MDGSSKLARSVWSQELDLPPSCVEFCPAFPSYFLVGTYCLQPENAGSDIDAVNADTEEEELQNTQPRQPQSRNGSIILFRVVDEGRTIQYIQTEPQPSAILDLHFNTSDGYRDVCAAVSSTATLALFKVSPGGDQALNHLSTMDITAMSQGVIKPLPGTEILFLSFCWHPSRPDIAAITTSTGHVYIVHLPALDRDWKLHSEPVISHTLEAWCVSISPTPAIPQQGVQPGEKGKVPLKVYSGGDDSKLCHRICDWDQGGLTELSPQFERRGHNAGVTAILPLFEQGDGLELVVTGSYDEHIRLIAVPHAGVARNLAESSLGGGVWRLKLIDLSRSSGQGDYNWRARILASCMHAGVRVVELIETAGGEHQFRGLGRFEEHKSMNYGSDFQPGRTDKLLIVSTSFYDKLLCLWEQEMD
ncbi:hypothetical protein VTK56DRAFT_5632 [Thermocarpiscus australiensis]